MMWMFYLRAFEHLMIAHDIHEDSWACHIAPRLTGKAREAYTSLPVESLNSYSELKRAILARYQLNAETYRQKFRNSTKENNESYEEWGVRLKSFLERWLDTAGVKSGESPDFQELILIEQALEQIPKELGIWLREKQPKGLTELTKLADEYVSVRGIKYSGPSQSRYRFNQNASKSNQQPVVKQSAPDIKINSSVKGNANRACFICGNTAHLAYQCPQRVNKDNSSQWSGYNKKQALLCNKAVNRYECEGLINGREVVMLRDTGCDHTLVNCRLWTQSIMLRNWHGSGRALTRTKKGNRYVLVVVDYATRYPEAIPIPNQEAETIAEELVKLFSRVGIPEEIVSDQGTNFTSKLMKEVCNLLEIDHLKSSPYHPQTNGLVERFNGTLKSMLRAFVTQQPESWDRYIPYLLFAYREVPQSSTGFSPFELLYGRKVKGPLDVLKEEICNPEVSVVTRIS
ncbi:hypothetical protein BSL78_17652 [Apostichopus japonicus]|uniref:Uncharacterized protein n=1 Tax=Stichopus japonicus TaxID=307972 RepID=A0A2G8KBV3_STIJA|nr:hypothetical protein BSL78_17652 [Apostichopus japonicus]